MKGTRLRSLLYLDTARLGPMSPSAQRAQLDFVRLAAEVPSSLYFEEFLRDGYEAWPSSHQARFPGLATWTAVRGLKDSLRTLAGAPDNWNVLLTSRSLSLVRLAARRMFHVCRNVLTTDLSWPSYQQAIERHVQRYGARVTVFPLRDQILYQHWTVSDVVSHLSTAFAANGCDGLFLPAVDHLGVRLPIREIVRQIKRRRELRFSIIDAAQAFCQVPIAECFDCADFVVAGSHKWMGAYLPTGIGFVGRRYRHSQDQSQRSGRNNNQAITDPLLHFTQQLHTGGLDGHSETVNVTPLFTCSAAAADAVVTLQLHAAIPPIEIVQKKIPVSRNWQPRQPHESLRSRIVLFETRCAALRRESTEAIRRLWLEAGLVVTAYPGGRVRVSL
ncbi:MAG: aminotransferase class V-fold PLP-dependent enzyme, partial [Verrucomicrobiales bacterium]|nr:aminotransferase class V-fold PLP-dependent enzyme [Verrucomicrobiales bacterium]